MRRRTEVWTVTDIAEAFEVARSTANTWARDDSFPRPLPGTRHVRVYDAAEVRDWRRKRRAER